MDRIRLGILQVNHDKSDTGNNEDDRNTNIAIKCKEVRLSIQSMPE